MKMLRYMYGEILIVTVILVGMATLAHARTGAPSPHADTVAVFHENPYVYLYGQIAGGQVLSAEHVSFTAISFQPAYTLLQENLLFCDNQAAAFHGKIGLVVITYERKAGAMLHGVACHALTSVDLVPVEQP